jgi:hypothetical protein
MLISPILTERGREGPPEMSVDELSADSDGQPRNRIFRNLLNWLRCLAPGVTMLQPTQPRKRNYSRICSRPLFYCTPVRASFRSES